VASKGDGSTNKASEWPIGILPTRPVSNIRAQFRDVSLVEAADGEFAQLMALFAAWRADIDAEPFAYSDEELLRTLDRGPVCSRLDHRAAPRASRVGPEPPCPHRT